MANSSSNDPVRLFADFHGADRQGRLRLNCDGTKWDLERLGINLEEGLEIVVYSEELEADAWVTFSSEEGIWVASIDWNEIRTVPVPHEAPRPPKA